MSKEVHARYEVSQGAVIENKKGEILLLKLCNRGWAIPGGHLRKNEDWIDGLQREIAEETGIKNLNVKNVLGVCIFGTCYGVCFHCALPDASGTDIVLSDEHEDFAWVSSKEDVSKYNFHHPALKDFVLKVFEAR
ncbi:NUDIX domain-containing protein [Candidatus Dependentiae bacterium]